jgi:hypothetical protein
MGYGDPPRQKLFSLLNRYEPLWLLPRFACPTGDKVPYFLVLAKEILEFDQEVGFS